MNGNWVEDEPQLQSLASAYFHSLFTEEMDQRLYMSPSCHFHLIDGIFNNIMVEEFSNEEVRRAIFDIGSTKAPVPYGYSALFFQAN